MFKLRIQYILHYIYLQSNKSEPYSPNPLIPIICLQFPTTRAIFICASLRTQATTMIVLWNCFFL